MKALFYVDYADIQHPSPLTKAFYFVASLGHQAVVVFFVLSGFFIASSVFRMHTQTKWSWREYLIQRLVRLWVVLIPALFLTAFWDLSGISLFGKSVYTGLPSDQYILAFSTISHLKAPIFLGNVFFLQGIATTTFGSNGPLWSLSYEFWYYIAFPCLLLMVLSRRNSTRAIYGVLVLALGWFVGKAIAISFAVWLLGVVIIFLPHLWNKHRPVSPYVIWAATIPFLAALIASVIKKNDDVPWFIAVTFAALTYLILRLSDSPQKPNGPSRLTTFSKNIAGFSYSLYLLHLPPLVFLHAYLFSIQQPKWQPDVPHALIGVLIAAGILAYSWVIASFTEFKTASFRRLLKRRPSS